MQKIYFRTGMILMAAQLLTACAQFERNQPVASTDDDAICRTNGVAVGSKDYIACRKDRDVQSTQTDRMERAHRNLAEDMLNHRPE